MLVLARKKGESIVFDERIRVNILQIRGGTIRVGIEAPREINVRRGELARKKYCVSASTLKPTDS